MCVFRLLCCLSQRFVNGLRRFCSTTISLCLSCVYSRERLSVFLFSLLRCLEIHRQSFHWATGLVSVNRFNVCEYDLSTCIDIHRRRRHRRNEPKMCLQNCVCVSVAHLALTSHTHRQLCSSFGIQQNARTSFVRSSAPHISLFRFLFWHFCRAFSIHSIQFWCVHHVAQLVPKSRTIRCYSHASLRRQFHTQFKNKFCLHNTF